MELDKILKMPSLKAAPFLLGCEISRLTPAGEIRLRLVEVEAYHQDDPASHSSHGNTPRTAPMFKSGGHLYVYFTYGMHYCINIVTGREGTGEGVLLRAAEPVKGLEIMKKNRGTDDIYKLASGPGRLAQALGIKDTALSGKKIGKDTVNLLPPQLKVEPEAIIISSRVGIRLAKDEPWRFYIRSSPFVSYKKH